MEMGQWQMTRFDDELSKEECEVTLLVGDCKFYVKREPLTTHSTYFKCLFSTVSSESKNLEFELKDIDRSSFHFFLEVVHQFPIMQPNAVIGVLHLADLYDSRFAIQKCEEHLFDNWTYSNKEKLIMASKYKMDELKKDCISQLRTVAEIKAILPEDPEETKKFDSQLLIDLDSKLIALMEL